MPRPHRLSKSRFMTGLQCHRRLWWEVHEPGAPELAPGPAQQMVFDEGTRVGEVARTHVPGGTLVDPPHRDYEARLALTREAMATDTPAVYEASFTADDVFVSVDILARERDGWRLIEVKSSTRVKDQHLPDAAIQTHVVRRSGVNVTGTEVMVLNAQCTHPDLSNLFRREEVSGSIAPLMGAIPGFVAQQIRMLDGPLPEVGIGGHCDSPYTCPFKRRCWAEVPEHHVSTLYYMRGQAWAFEDMGWRTIHDLPDDLVLQTPQTDRQRRAVKAGRMVVEGDLASALACFRRPIAHLDFETVAPAIPAWNGCRPFDTVPAQFSCHVEVDDDTLEHHEWIADGPADPRPEIARQVIAACAGARTVLAYYADFEKRCLQHLARAVPDAAGALDDIVRRLVDPRPVLLNHVYHPDFRGSFSLKDVLPALVPDLGYDGLAIPEGQLASAALRRLMLEGAGLAPAGPAETRAALLEYCRTDTMATVRLLARLRELAGIA